ncbi:MAG: hypothetical protein Q9228_008048, partial [Teloschistes exilis]
SALRNEGTNLTNPTGVTDVAVKEDEDTKAAMAPPENTTAINGEGDERLENGIVGKRKVEEDSGDETGNDSKRPKVVNISKQESPLHDTLEPIPQSNAETQEESGSEIPTDQPVRVQSPSPITLNSVQEERGEADAVAEDVNQDEEAIVDEQVI